MKEGVLPYVPRSNLHRDRTDMVDKRFVFILGTGRCGMTSLRALLNAQPSTDIRSAEAPCLPWCPAANDVMPHRLRRQFNSASSAVVGESAWFLINYVHQMMELLENVTIVILERDVEQTVASIKRWLASRFSIATDHWTRTPGAGRHHHPFLTPTFPQFSEDTVERGIRRYCEHYKSIVDQLIQQYPSRCQRFSMDTALNSINGQQQLLDFCGYQSGGHVLQVGIHHHRWNPRGVTKAAKARLEADDPGNCVVLVPTGESIPVVCERSLRELENRGYVVRRLSGHSAIDQARNVLATQALLDGFAETMWIDSDIEFDPDEVEKLRRHGLPIVSGVYAKKGRQAIASNVLPATESFVFGPHGKLYEIAYAGTGFLYVRREVYENIQLQLRLPVCNELFGEPIVPFFHPRMRPQEDGTWYLAEDFSFSHRARECGYQIMADTTIRLWHIGSYRYGWEDACHAPSRYTDFTMQFRQQQDRKRPPDHGHVP